MDARLEHVDMPDWQRGARQQYLSSDYITIDPSSKISDEPTQVDFDLPKKESLLFGPSSKFRIRGVFQKLLDGTVDWIKVPASDIDKVLVSSNWFEMLIKEISIFHETYRIATSQENRHIAPFINAYLYHNMDPLTKRLLCPQACHPGYCVPAVDGKWEMTNTTWQNYAKTIFTEAQIAFDYIPLFQFPLFQGSNFMTDDAVPRILPTPAMGRLELRIAFTDSQDHIFRIPATNKAKYRFKFTEISLMVEEARLSAPFKKQLENGKRPLAFPGVTRIQLAEQIPNSASTFRAKFQDIYLPEGLFIFCLKKTVASGTYKFSNDDATNVFIDHNIQSIDLAFGGKRFSLREPHAGTFLDDRMDAKQLFDHLVNPPFGIRQDARKLTLNVIAEGGKKSPFPHVYLSLVTGPDRQRLIPATDDGSLVMQKADLELDFKFTEDNSTNNAIYVIVAIYTDVCIVYDPKKMHFSSPYLQYMN